MKRYIYQSFKANIYLMLKILAFSDLHGDKGDLEKLITLESNNNFHAIVAAGDIGSYGNEDHSLVEVAELLESFSCPFLFVLGNSDPEGDEQNIKWPANCHNLNFQPKQIGDYFFVGIDGIYDLSKSSFRIKRAKDQFVKLHKLVKYCNIDPCKLIIITHERMYRLNDFFRTGNPLVYMFGHHHRPMHTNVNKTNYINCSVLDGNRSRWGAGNYWIIEINDDKVISFPKPIARPSKRTLIFNKKRAQQEMKVFAKMYPEIEFNIPDNGWFEIPLDK
ncbi:metallophosphoesterase family protein [Desulfosediminicola sp.]|uniref:metallophosphoesterase family protein n=1 Tax=Desulfosediminicola sp. TaxID=2886825 RepID=UPI003AF2E179